VAGSIIVPVPLGERAYDVRIGRLDAGGVATALAAALDLPRPSGVAVLVDGDVGKRSPLVTPLVEALAARLPRVRRHDLLPGEACKNLAELGRTLEWLAAEGYDRGAAVVGIGGGAAGDHAGFAAAVYLRGVRFALCPTTLLAMVDASVGGKTAVDLAAGKNLVGAFHQPRAVEADTTFLETLPAREWTAGLAEVVKCGLIADGDLLATLERSGPALVPGGDPAVAAAGEALAQVIAAAVRIKAQVVCEDERESGRRATLNFGHTVGHAVEAASAYELLHGEAVSLGMVAALSLGVTMGLTPPALLARGRALLASLGLPVDVERRLTPEVLSRIDVDKKRRSDSVRFVFCTAPGTTLMEDVPLEKLRSLLLAAKPR
jgi:3-dehydroquinate synthase